MINKFFSILAIGFLLCNGLFSQTTLDITATRDNSIYSESGITSNGSGAYLFSGETNGSNLRRSLIFFNLSSIPQGAVISSVTLKLSCSKAGSGTGGLAIHKMAQAWGEGNSDAGGQEGTGASAQTNDATWTVPFFGQGTTWTVPGGDYNNTASASVASVNSGDNLTITSPGLIQDVQNWVTDGTTNFGWALLGSEGTARSARRYNSRASGASGPVLTISYSLVLPVSLLEFKAVREKTEVRLEWRTEKEKNLKQYEIEYSTDAVNFSRIQAIQANGNTYYTANHYSPVDGNNFYRLKMVDKDGSFSLSKVVSVLVHADHSTIVWPNPARQQIQVTVPAGFKAKRYRILDFSGRDALQGNFTASSIQVASLPAGLYSIMLISDSGEEMNVRFQKW